MGIFWEPGWQAWVLDHIPYSAVVLNWAYIITYWPVVLGIGLVIYVNHRQRYYYYRTAIVITLAAILLMFAFSPVAPPFTSTGHFVDTIQTYGPTWYGSPEMSIFYNTNAAMPSLNFSWTLVLGVLFFRHLKGWHKLWGPVYPVLTLFAIVITGNHFFLDAIAGGLLAVAAFFVVELAFRRRRGTH